MVSSRRGPVEISTAGAPQRSSNERTYFFAAAGRSSNRVTAVVFSRHPGIVSNRGFTRATSSDSAGTSAISRPSSSYATHTGISARSSSTSSFVIATAAAPESSTAVRATTASNQPVRRGRPVDVPYSLPRARRNSPVSSKSSTGNGPSPTRVEYALSTTSDASSGRGGMWSPPATRADEQHDDVT